MGDGPAARSGEQVRLPFPSAVGRAEGTVEALAAPDLAVMLRGEAVELLVRGDLRLVQLTARHAVSACAVVSMTVVTAHSGQGVTCRDSVVGRPEPHPRRRGEEER